MEIINKGEIKKFVRIILFLTIILTVVPIIAYVLNFSGEISDDQSDWGNFGDFFGGIVGTIFNLIAVVFSFLSIYITLKIATRIYQEEEKLHKENDSREEKRFEREIELIHAQNKPLPCIFEDYSSEEKVEIHLENHGLGSLKINSWSIIYNGKTFSHFENLLDQLEIFPKGIRVEWDDSLEHMLAPGKQKNLLKILSKSDIEDKTNFTEYFNKSKEIFKSSEIFFNYEDMFGNKFSFSHKLQP